MTATPAAAAIISKKRRQIINAFRVASATTPQNAKTLKQLGLHDSPLFRIQVQRRAIVPAQENRFYLDEHRMITIDHQRRLILTSLIILLIALIYLLNR